MQPVWCIEVEKNTSGFQVVSGSVDFRLINLTFDTELFFVLLIIALKKTFYFGAKQKTLSCASCFPVYLKVSLAIIS